MSKPPTGGRPHDNFVFEHFIALDKNPSTKRWTMRCKYCPDATPTIIHRGMLRNHYMRQLGEQALAMGKSTHRKHAHMHTLTEKGIDIVRATELIDNFTIPTPFVTGYDDANIEGPEGISLDEIDQEFSALDKSAFSAVDGDQHGPEVSLDDVYDLSGLHKIRAGEQIGEVEEDIEIVTSGGATEGWDTTSLLRSLSI